MSIRWFLYQWRAMMLLYLAQDQQVVLGANKDMLAGAGDKAGGELLESFDHS